MPASAVTNLTYPLLDFVASGGIVNPQILQQELSAAGLTVLQVSTSSVDCTVSLSGDASASDIATADGVVAAHTGSSFAPDSALKKISVAAESADDTGVEVSKCSLSVGPLPEGTYLCTYSMEVSLTSEGGTATVVKALLKLTHNGGSANEVGEHNSSHPGWSKFSEAYMFDVVAGDTYSFELVFQRVGTAGNAARARRARITWMKVG
jgi:hypothetical protein